MYIGTTESTHYSCQILIKPEFSRQIFKKYTNIKFHENLSCGIRVIPCRQMGQRDMTRLTVAFRAFANAPKNLLLLAQ